MGFSCGIVGLPNVGKSTIFNALTRGAVPASNYPFCTIEPHTGVVPVPDERLETLAKLAPKERSVPAVMQFVDIAGLVEGANQGEGLGNQSLGHIAEVEALVHVVRCFEDDQVIHVTGAVDPRRDIEVVQTELALRDMGAVTAAVRRAEKQARAGEPAAPDVLEGLQQLADRLDQAQPARLVLSELSDAAREAVRALNLLTAKPVIYVANVDEREAAAARSPTIDLVREVAGADGAEIVVICGAVEAQIAALDSAEERQEFLEALGLAESGLQRLVKVGYALLGYITFFTLGTDENRAWTLRRGSTAVDAAGKVHTDMARGFIRAEVMSFEDLLACGSESSVQAAGRLRIEGKSYMVQDGDVLRIRFNV